MHRPAVTTGLALALAACHGRGTGIPASAPAPTPPAGHVAPLTPIRKTIAARMVESLRTTAPVTLTSTVDATNLVNLRGQFKAVAGGAPVPSFTDFLLKLVAVALGKHPVMAARWTDAGLAHAARIDIGVQEIVARVEGAGAVRARPQGSVGLILFGIDSRDPAIEAQIEALRDSGKIVHLYGTLVSDVPDVNGSQILVVSLVVDE